MLLAEIDYNLLLRLVLEGLIFGLFVALVALGYSMVYGIIGLINFAHGEVFMLGCFLCAALIDLAYVCCGWQSLPAMGHLLWLIPVLLVLTAAGCAALNWSIDRIVYRPLRSAPKLAPLVSAIGVSFVLMNVGLLWGGSQDFSVRPVVAGNKLFAGDEGWNLDSRQLLSAAVTLPVMALLVWLVHRTLIGKAMRAVQQNSVAAELMGVPVQRVIGSTFLLGGALAGIAAVIYCLTNGTNNYTMGYKYGLYAFTAAVLGGIGKIPGTVLGGIVIGLVRSLTEGYLRAEWSNTLIFGILIVILVFRPAGLIGRAQREKV